LLLLALCVLLPALALRYGVIEAGRLPAACPPAGALACVFRDVLVWTFLGSKIGWLALLAGASAFVSGSRVLGWAGWLCGLYGSVLYSYDPAVPGALLGLLVLLCNRNEAAEGQQQANA
jgi:hypothetical protein